MNGSLLPATVWFYMRQLGWPGLAGASLICGALLVQCLVTLPKQADAGTLRTSLEARRSLRTATPTPAQVVLSHQARVLASLPGADGAPVAVKTIHDAASARGLSVQRADYRLTREASAAWTRYQITIPARGDYARLRAWLDDVLTELPSVALDDIQLRRDDVSEDMVDARVRLTLFQKAAP